MAIGVRSVPGIRGERGSRLNQIYDKPASLLEGAINGLEGSLG